jgi:2-amino-4-hydroxy-6-hydroxymethyldihydropteridine diphosphokinase
VSVEAALGLGGNVGDVGHTLIAALKQMAAAPGVKLARVSSIYATPPWGGLDQPSFLNMAAIVATDLPAQALLALCLDIERGMGRQRLERWGPRTLDIDILTYGDQMIDAPDLKVPHPRMTQRAFVLTPLVEIAPGLRIGGSEIEEWLALADRAGIAVDRQQSDRLRDALGCDRDAR